jgi:hypothetical protein
VAEGGNLSGQGSVPHVDPHVDGAGRSTPEYLRELAEMGVEPGGRLRRRHLPGYGTIGSQDFLSGGSLRVVFQSTAETGRALRPDQRSTIEMYHRKRIN